MPNADGAYRVVLQLDASCKGMDVKPASKYYHMAADAISLRFVLQEGFEDGITNDIQVPPWLGKTGALAVVWRGGRIDDLKIQLKLAAGVGDIQTADELTEIVGVLYDMALPVGFGKSLGIVVASIGATDPKNQNVEFWFRRIGLMKQASVKFERPWDIVSGKPMVATVNLLVSPFWATNEYGDAIYTNGLPVYRPWTWNWAARQG